MPLFFEISLWEAAVDLAVNAGTVVGVSAFQREGQGTLSCGLDGILGETAAEERSEVVEDRLTKDDEDPRVKDWVTGREAESHEVLLVVPYRTKGVHKTTNLREK